MDIASSHPISVVTAEISSQFPMVFPTRYMSFRVINLNRRFSTPDFVILRPFIMRSDSKLMILIFRSEKKMGLLMQSDFAKSDGTKSDLRIRWPKSSDFGPKSNGSTHRIIKSKNGIGLQ